MQILIVGCGRLGGQLVSDLGTQGHEISVVDLDVGAFRRLSEDFKGRVVVGTGIDEDVLKSAGIEAADVFIAVTDDDNTNIMAAQIAQTVYRVPRVLLRIYDPQRAAVYRGLNLSVICPTSTVADLIEEQVAQAASERGRRA